MGVYQQTIIRSRASTREEGTYIVPKGDTPNGPLPAHVVVVGAVDVVLEELQELVGFGFLELGEAGHEAGVDVEGFEACDGVGAWEYIRFAISIERLGELKGRL